MLAVDRVAFPELDVSKLKLPEISLPSIDTSSINVDVSNVLNELKDKLLNQNLNTVDLSADLSADLSSLSSSLKDALTDMTQSRSPEEIIGALGGVLSDIKSTQLFDALSHSPVAQALTGFYLSFALISWVLTPPSLPVPYPSGTYDARTAAQYFSTRGFTQLARCVEIGGLSAGFVLQALVLDKVRVRGGGR